MGLSSCCTGGAICLLLSFTNVMHAFASHGSHLCRPDQKDALMEFKNEFQIHRLDDDWKNNYPKTKSWNKNADCCLWDGVTCDSSSGDVTGLDLNGCLLNGPLKSNSSLFRLRRLQSLDLGANNLSGRLPDSIDKLKALNFLNLYSCNLFGQIPSSIGNLSYVTDLDLSSNNFVGEVPSSIGSLSRLTQLQLVNSNLSGNFPLALLNLTKLERIDLRSNQFTGQLPSNLSRLSKLEDFEVSGNSFSGTIPSSLFMIPSLVWAMFSQNQLTGPLEIGNVSSSSKLGVLSLDDNNFHGPIPVSVSKLVGLWFLDLSSWNMEGSAMDFGMFSRLKSLTLLDLSFLNTASTVELSVFSNLKSLSTLDLSGSKVSISSTTSLPLQMETLTLSSCSIGEFPSFLMALKDLTYLDLSYNQIQGPVPEGLWKLPVLSFVNISHNSFRAFEGSLADTRIVMIDMSSNAFHGPFPMLPVSTMHLLGSTNYFSGEIPRRICRLTNLYTLDLSNNNFSGSIPRCFENLKSNLSVLHLQNNSLTGSIPPTSIDAYNLKSLNLGHNRLVGTLPRALGNCTRLQLLNVENNKINDIYPFWLESLPELLVLVLRLNEFYGPISSPRSSLGFPMLRMIDISQNHLSGALPSHYFANWSAMSVMKTLKDHTLSRFAGRGSGYSHESVVFTIKGLQIELVGSSYAIYTSIDFSGNRFTGEIPQSIGLLEEVIVLNLSSNGFTGHVPPSLANLTKLQSLDLSRNELSGSIPQELGKLSFLSVINLSYNNLEGPIPQGAQFQSQPCSAFSHNLGLYGLPLGQSCGQAHTPAPAPQEEEAEAEEVISWIAAGIGIAPGVAFGWTIGYIVASCKHEWLIRTSDRIRRIWLSR
ncbi:PREDICTED: receptor like protein 30-like [Tarenaya hassleriana]|uniref:receptor like protein 30-like n=1 Tax=Tarenaya hassleriana TaxID=28532 RepID=UPI0008FD9298|nr:PREDICTED: receptor like protein 30-like [Tarenaya hassleriana]